ADVGPAAALTGPAQRGDWDTIRRHLDAPRPEGHHLYGDGQAGRRIADILATAPLDIDKRLTY
ncbi:MAG: DUF2520 domain-containing protein, partial [Acidobacteriota bacterium]